MKRVSSGLALTVAGLMSASAWAQSAPPASDAAPDGRTLFRTKTCVACHGKDGAKAIQNYPELAGQDKAYLLAQMKDIKSGTRVAGKDERGNPRTQGMRDVMHLFNDAEMKAIADWLSTVPSPAPRKPAEPIPQETLDKGKTAFTQGGCQTCHGVNGLKPLATYPLIAGQKREYLVLQMTEMRDGVRTNGKSKLMLPFAKKLNNEQIELIATYLSQIERPKP
jgi:cytochrome c553